MTLPIQQSSVHAIVCIYMDITIMSIVCMAYLIISIMYM
jgi:hypothetical protein